MNGAIRRVEESLDYMRTQIDRQGTQSVLPRGTEMANPILLNPSSRTALADILSVTVTEIDASMTWPASNRAIFYPFFITQVDTLRKMFCYNGLTASGNVDVGIYRDRYDGSLARVVANGGTAQTGTSALQALTAQNLVLLPGRYYFAMSMDNATGTVAGWDTADLEMLKGAGMAQMANAYPLPATATLAVLASNKLPFAGLSFRDLVA